MKMKDKWLWKEVGRLIIKDILAWSIFLIITSSKSEYAPIFLIIPFLIIQDWKTLRYIVNR